MSQIMESYSLMANAAAMGLQSFYKEKFGVYVDEIDKNCPIPEEGPIFYNWWPTAVGLEGIIDYMIFTGSTEYHDVIFKTFEAAPKSQGSKDFLNHYYDDEGWWAITWIKAYDLTQEIFYLKMAETIFANMKTGWEEKTCGGGIWWTKSRGYKAAIQNELFLVVATRLHLRKANNSGQKSYSDWALGEWEWFKKTGMINASNLVNNGLNDNCENDMKPTWTYNQGVILGGLVDLYQITKNYELIAQAQAIAQAAICKLRYPNRVLQEPTETTKTFDCDRDAQCFKGIFMRYLAYLYSNLRKLDRSTLEAVKAETLKLVNGQCEQIVFADLRKINAPLYDTLAFYEDWITLNADSLWNNAKDQQSNGFGSRWVGPYDNNNVPKQTSALAALNAAIPFQRIK